MLFLKVIGFVRNVLVKSSFSMKIRAKMTNNLPNHLLKTVGSFFGEGDNRQWFDGRFVMPAFLDYQRHLRSMSFSEGDVRHFNIELPYWISWSDGSSQFIVPDYAHTLLQAHHSSARNRHRSDVPVIHEESELFNGAAFAPGSLGATLSQSGALTFIASKHADGKLYELRDHYIPMGIVLPAPMHRKLTELFHDILKIADYFPAHSEPQKVMTLVAQLLNHFLYARGAHLSQIEECMSNFRQGKLDLL